MRVVRGKDTFSKRNSTQYADNNNSIITVVNHESMDIFPARVESIFFTIDAESGVIEGPLFFISILPVYSSTFT